MLPVAITQEFEEKRRKQVKLTEKEVSTAVLKLSTTVLFSTARKHAHVIEHGRAKLSTSTAVLNSNFEDFKHRLSSTVVLK